MNKTLIVAAMAAFFAVSVQAAEAVDTDAGSCITKKTLAATIYLDKRFTNQSHMYENETTFVVTQSFKNGYIIQTKPGMENNPPVVIGFVKKKDYKFIDYRNCNF